ncbi:MAG TPA: hypothetical protein PLV72_00920 [Candidatus Magasanikbacteria bacterium]|nr:hypothetical protein [Candidatus Magasanikbacteria bacterium]
MDEQKIEQSQDSVQKTNNVWTIIIVVVITALLAGGIVYVWQKSEFESTEIKLQQQITDLQNQVNQISQDNSIATENLIDEKKTADSQYQKKSTTLTKAKEDGRFVYYDGSITISGKYQEFYPETLLGSELCFYADDETGYLIPRDPNLWGEGNGDNRIPWFCFNDQDNVKEMFGIDDSAIFSDKTIECIQGKATIVISNYKVDKLESSVFDTANLDKIISKETYKTKCE